MKHLAVLICANGLGHFRRATQVLERLLVTHSQEIETTIFAAPWQREKLSPVSWVQHLADHPRVRFIDYAPPVTQQRCHSLQSWHEELKQLRLEDYDLVLSDNLVEALHYSNKVCLEGSFLWHDLFEKFWPKDPDVEEYVQSCRNLLEKSKPPMIVNKYFAMASARAQVTPISVGLLPAQTRTVAKKRSPLGILLAYSSSSLLQEQMKKFVSQSKNSKSDKIEYYADQILWGDSGIKSFDWSQNTLGSIHVVIGRAGMGTITDCLGTGTFLVVVDEPENPEISHNGRILKKLGLGQVARDLDEALDRAREFCLSEKGRENFLKALGSLDWNGLEESVTYISKLLDEE